MSHLTNKIEQFSLVKNIKYEHHIKFGFPFCPILMEHYILFHKNFGYTTRIKFLNMYIRKLLSLLFCCNYLCICQPYFICIRNGLPGGKNKWHKLQFNFLWSII